ncbi:alpha/beta fold hydrolase [Kriegella sp. EG-1]|nr:alpha/beta fold hydrolase [Flavobacteriaceae bacterium EG-1]
MAVEKKYIALFYFLAASYILSSCASIPKLSKTDRSTIRKVLNTSTPKIISGETGFAKNNTHSIWYEKISPPKQIIGTVLLIMGNGQDALSWPPNFITNLTNAGYQVIRYDHRGTGFSSSTVKWKKKKAYSLSDMATDAIAILDTLAIEKSHIIGVSMGGMIAQLIAIEYPERTSTLTSIMSSGNVLDPELAPMSNEVIPKMISAILKHGFFGSKKGQIKRQIIQKRILMGEATGDIDVKTMAEISAYNLKERTGYNLIAAKHHFRAIIISDSRNVDLPNLTIPTLIIHGKKDPVMPFSHGEKMKRLIPNAKSLWIENMGHDLPDAKIKEISETILLSFKSTIN